MPYLINPGGRMVAIDNLDVFDYYKNKTGFRLPKPEQITEFEKQRCEMFEKMRDSANQSRVYKKDSIHFATVTQGLRADGYGMASAAMIEGLKKYGIDAQTSYDGQKVAVLFHAPYSLTSLASPIKVLYTMFESDKIPDEWTPYLQVADLIIVPSKWCADVFKKAGFDTRVVPLGYNDNVYNPIERKIKRDTREDFVFLHYNAFNIRKGFPEVFKAFLQEFKPDEPVKMILKTTQKWSQIPAPFRAMNYPNIKIIAESYTEGQMYDLMRQSDCFVFPSRGEGFGLTPLEAMATGLPTIVPNAHGITEYFDDRYMYEVKVKEECPALYSRYKNQDVGKMVVCDVDHLRSQMRWIYEHEKEAKQKGEQASEYATNWTIDKTSQMLADIVKEMMKMVVQNKELVDHLILEKIT